MWLIATALFFSTPQPVAMPHAEAYLVQTDEGTYQLEDRYWTLDLWTSAVVKGRWLDDEGRVFTLAELSLAPPLNNSGVTETRLNYRGSVSEIDKKDLPELKRAIEQLANYELAESPAPARQIPHGYKDVDYYEGTNSSVIICAYLPEKSETWQLAMWELNSSDLLEEKRAEFETEYLYKRLWETLPPTKKREKITSEREWLRQDVEHAVAAYPQWHTTQSEEFSIVDDLPNGSSFADDLTNSLPQLRAKFAKTLPTPVDGTNVLAVARIFGSREEYLEALSLEGLDGLNWSAAYWSNTRRELVAYLPPQGEAELLKTFRHEAFHQYLAYATAMIPVSPWLNEGYAQYFERDAPYFVDPADLGSLAEAIPALLMMNYEEFYAGTDHERALKYRLAHTIAYFIEHGVSEVRFQPFKDLKRDYFKALLKTKNMREATLSAFGSSDKLKLFVAEWTKYWQNM